MKLYTEKQVIAMIEKSRETGLTAEYLIMATNGLKLPSDEKAAVIALKIAEILKEHLTSQEEAFYLSGFQTCIEWLRDEIEGINK